MVKKFILAASVKSLTFPTARLRHEKGQIRWPPYMADIYRHEPPPLPVNKLLPYYNIILKHIHMFNTYIYTICTYLSRTLNSNRLYSFLSFCITLAGNIVFSCSFNIMDTYKYNYRHTSFFVCMWVCILY